LDVNTNSTGYTVLDKESGKIIKAWFIDTKKQTTLTEKALIVKQTLQTLYDENKGARWIVGLEDFILFFKGGSFVVEKKKN
jgi:hypothetical protein